MKVPEQIHNRNLTCIFYNIRHPLLEIYVLLTFPKIQIFLPTIELKKICMIWASRPYILLTFKFHITFGCKTSVTTVTNFIIKPFSDETFIGYCTSIDYSFVTFPPICIFMIE